MALTAALLGWLFDGLEMGLFPLVQKPCLDELVTDPDDRTLWIGIITSFFLIGAATGGVLFGWLGDRIGRVRSMMLSVLTYAVVSGLCGFASEAWQIGILRFVAAMGMGGEWSLGVALINEIWPDRSRAFLAGLIGAAANVGYLLIGTVGLGVIQQVGQLQSALISIGLPEAWAKHLMQNEAWRFLMMLGAVPALLTFFIRWFVPESEKWERERGKGATSYWATRDLAGVFVGALAVCGVIILWAQKFHWSICIAGTVVGLAVVTWGYTFPVLRYLQRASASGTFVGDWKATLVQMLLAAVISGVALLGTWGTIQHAPKWAGDLVQAERKTYTAEELQTPAPAAKEWTQIATAFGAIVGTIAAAMLGGWLGRRITYFFLCIGSFVAIQLFFQTCTVYDAKFLLLACLAGAVSASFYGWLPLYLPELFPTAIRATGQGFGFNFGRILAAIGVLQLSTLQGAFGGLPQACAALSFIYVVGLGVIWLVPETKGKPLPD
ncbi:MAG: MFS transporter [Planctomycetes bacterium]|nr:MFS transporter [Planctomycetota bacterium]